MRPAPSNASYATAMAGFRLSAGTDEQAGLKLDRMAELAAMARETGRPAYPITTNATPRNPEKIEKLAEAGVTRCLFGLKSASADEVLPRLDKLARLTEDVRRRL